MGGHHNRRAPMDTSCCTCPGLFSRHALRRMNARCITDRAVELVQQYGREIHARGAIYYVVGRKEVESLADRVDLSWVEGIHVLLSRDGWVITTYRNRAFRPHRYRKPEYRHRSK